MHVHGSADRESRSCGRLRPDHTRRRGEASLTTAYGPTGSATNTQLLSAPSRQVRDDLPSTAHRPAYICPRAHPYLSVAPRARLCKHVLRRLPRVLVATTAVPAPSCALCACARCRCRVATARPRPLRCPRLLVAGRPAWLQTTAFPSVPQHPR